MKLQKGQLFRAFFGVRTDLDFYCLETLLFSEGSTEETYCYDKDHVMFHKLVFVALEEIDLSLPENNIVGVYAVGLDKVGYLQYDSSENSIEFL